MPRTVQSPSAAELLVGNYFVSAYPPFSRWQPAQTGAVECVLDLPAPQTPIGIYVHIPFCEKKCDFCYYLSRAGAKAFEVDAYLEKVVDELALYARHPALRERRVSFVYFGGGTPSLLTPEQIHFVVSGLQRALSWRGVEEITYEVAPRTARRDRLEALIKIGVNRISMGVQSFADDLLRLNGRIHLSADVLRAYALLREFGCDWINLDLMVGLVGETRALWKDSVRRAIELSPDSVTVYQTEIPRNTKLYRDLQEGNPAADPIPREVARGRLNWAFRELERAGYTVVSGYAASKDPDRHRFCYQEYLWRGGDMLGLGAASFSYLNGVHFQNTAGLGEYQARVGDGQLPVYRAHRLTERERLVREFILQLKWGAVGAADFQAKFGVDVLEEFSQTLDEAAAEGWLTVVDDGVRLTRAGLLRVDSLLPRFYQSEYRGVSYW